MEFGSEDLEEYIVRKWHFFYLDLEHLENSSLSFWMSELNRLSFKINTFFP